MKNTYEIKGLRVSFKGTNGYNVAIDGVDFYADQGEIVCVVGESGSGKSVTQLAALQLIPSPPGRIDAGNVLLEGTDLLSMDPGSSALTNIRGGKIGMIFQEPMTSLDPVHTIGEQISEAVALHHSQFTKAEIEKRVLELLEDVGITDARARMQCYPHQFSGGMRQRIMIAIALAGDPKVIVADEPTTALDVTTQGQILDLLERIARERGTALIIITHNLGIVAKYADRIYVMYAGNMVEKGKVEDIFAHPAHPYTIGLLKSVPRLDDPRDRRLIPIEGTPLDLSRRPAGCPFADRCPFAESACTEADMHDFKPAVGQGHETVCIYTKAQLEEKEREKDHTEGKISREKSLGEDMVHVNALTVSYEVKSSIFRKKRQYADVLTGISFQVRKGETLGIVGESGCGKTTVAKSIMQLIPEARGEIWLDGKCLSHLKGEALRKERRHIQMIFQDPYSSLDPRMTIGEMIGEPLRIHGLVKDEQAYDMRVKELMELVGLNLSWQERYAYEFSGGQRQRVGIARALAADPKVIVCDEPISALDVSIQAQIINLLEKLQRELGLTYLFIAHDLAVVKHISDTIAVMYLGEIVEMASCEELYANPLHPYTRALLSAIPIPDPAVEKTREKIAMHGEVPGIMNRPKGCAFADRCPYAQPACKEEKNYYTKVTDNHIVACRRYMDKLE